jgi:transcription termination factor Rho
MDEKVETLSTEAETGEAELPVAPERGEGKSDADQDAADTAAPGVQALDLNELQEFSEKKLKALARDFDLHLHPARSRHQHILDIVRAAISRGAAVSAEGFLDQVSDSFAMLRWPKLNFLPVPEDVAVPRTLIEQYDLRPGQKVAGTVRLPVQREKFLSLDKGYKGRESTCENGSNRPRSTNSRHSFRRAELSWRIQTRARLCARGRFADAARSRATRPHCCAARGWARPFC